MAALGHDHACPGALPPPHRLPEVLVAGGYHLARLSRSVLTHLHVGAPLESPAIPGLLAAAALAAAALGFRTRRRVRRGWRRRATTAAFGALTLLLLVVGAAAGVNSYAGYLPTLTSLAGGYPRPHAGDGRVVRLSLPDPRRGVTDGETYVYLPAGYDAPANRHARYPVLYLLPGNPGSAVDWLRAGQAGVTAGVLIRAGVVQPLILVAPSSNNGAFEDYECADAVGGPQLSTYLTTDLVRGIDARFRTVRSRLGRAIGGVSAGADCALDLALHHQQTYSVVVAHEPSGEPGGEALRLSFRGDRALYDANSPIRFLRGMRFRHPMSFYLDAGTADRGDVRRLETLTTELRDDGQYVYTRLEPGQSHTWREARSGLPYSLDFVSALFHPDSSGPSGFGAVTLARMACRNSRLAIATHTAQQLASLHHVTAPHG